MKFDSNGKTINRILENDIKVVRFQKSLKDGRKYVQLSFAVPGEKRALEALVPMAVVNSKDILKYLPEGYVVKFNPPTSQQTAYMRRIISDAQANNYCCCDMVEQGYNVGSDGRLIYGFGNLIVGDRSDVDYQVFNPLKLRADVKRIKETSRLDIFDWVYQWTEQEKYLSALLMVALSPFVYPILEKILPQSEALNAYVVGRTGSGKTSYAGLVTNIFQGKEFSYSLIADKESFYELIKNRSCIPVLVDDFNKSASHQDNYKKIAKLTELIQTKSSAGSFNKEISAENVKKISLIITAEESLKASSSMNRCVVIKFGDSFDEVALSQFQENNLFPVLAYRLVAWICLHFKDVCEKVRMRLVNSRVELPYKSIVGSGESRIRMSYQVMLVVQATLMEYLNTCMKCNESYGKKYTKIADSITQGIAESIRYTKEASRSTDENNIVHALVDLFKYNLDDKIADTPDEYFRTRDRLIFRHEDYYYFKGGDMARYLSERFYKISNKRISGELQKEGLLCVRKGECSFPLPKKLRKKYDQDGVRFYRIYADVLDALVKDSCDNVLELFGSSLRKYQS